MIEINWAIICITCAFIVLDLVTGIIKAIVTKTMDSTKMRTGLFHKLAFLIAIVLAILCEFGIAYGALEYADVSIAIPIQPFVCGFIILTELTSTLENLGEINPELKNKKFMDIFKHKETEND